MAGSSPAEAELLVARAAREDGKLSLRLAAVEPALDESCDRRVELLARDAPEQRLADLRLRPEAAAHEDVVGLHALAVVVARRRALEAEVGDPVLRAGVRAAVELQPSGDLRRRSAPRGARSARPRRGFVSVTEKLQCGSPVQAIERPRTGLTSSEKPIASSSAVASVDLLVRDVGDDEVLLARDADVGADALGEVGDRDHLVARDQAEVHRDADVARARPASARGRRGGRDGSRCAGRSKSASVRPSRSSTRSRMPSGPMSSIMNLRRALTRRDAVVEVVRPDAR